MHGLAAHGMALDVLDEHRAGRRAVHRDLEDRRPSAPGCCAGCGRRRRTARLAVAAVDDAGHLARRGAGGAPSGSPPRRGRSGRGWWRCRWDGHERRAHGSETPLPGSLGWVDFVMTPDEELVVIFGALHVVALALGVILFMHVPALGHRVVLEAARGRGGRRRGRQRPAPVLEAQAAPDRRRPAARRRAVAHAPARPLASCATPTRARCAGRPIRTCRAVRRSAAASTRLPARSGRRPPAASPRCR